MSIMSNFGALYFGPYGSSQEFFIAGAPLDPMVAKPKNIAKPLSSMIDGLKTIRADGW